MSKQVHRCAGLLLTISGPASPAAAAPWKGKRKPAKRKATTGSKRGGKPVGRE
jgi:DNA topoisomerase-3